MNLRDVAKYHTDWVKIAVFHGACKESSADIVQNVYLKLLELERKEGSLSRIEYKGEPNKGYLFSVIRSETFKYLKREGKYCNSNSNFSEIASEESDYKDKERLIETTYEALDTQLHWFSRKVFDIYINDNHTIRSLAEATGIGRGTIQHEIKYVKEKIREYTAARA